MPAILGNRDDEPQSQPGAGRPTLSRRLVLRASVVSAAAGLLAGASWAQSRREGAAGIPDWTAADIPDQSGRRILVTGGNGFPREGRSGLGYQTALALARAGADVTIASRNEPRGAEAVRRISAEVPGATIRFERLDLADLASVRAFAARLDGEGGGLDVLVNNAGVMGRIDREESVDGFERVFATNTLGAFTLTGLLLPMLRRGRAPRVVWVASMRTAESLPFADLQLEKSYDYAAAYDNTKLANLMLMLEFERRSAASGWGASSLAAHPGVARTNLIPDGPGLDSREGWRFRILPLMFQPAAQGALPILYAATAPQAAAGDYFGPKGFRGLRGLPGVATVPTAAGDRGSASTLWAALEGFGEVSFG